ncbi:YhbD family protein [Bacillus sp. MUM 13]|uniref:YhbD family protein n=1 Tax=Bacillus sp. MUM 13 TaxID=1678001 RepID=UPI0008F5ED53|nr:YhbD family protein [Bacillus sp. MUM 13]OIK09338.1 hypothetical protein BIV59_17225 [Bacillus sp. MUM 13]
MNEDLISKKELLEISGISYGQLYRWKRKDLIPEDWFIRKSTFTGQETFFPKSRILERIERIQTMKESLSLDELADMFAPGSGKLLNKEEIIRRGVASEYTVQFYLEHTGFKDNSFQFDSMLVIYILEKLLKSGDISLDEGKMVLHLLHDKYESSGKNKELSLLVIRKFGISSCLLVSNSEDIYFEKDTKIISAIDFSKCSEELKIKWV